MPRRAPPAWWGSVTALLPRADDGIVLGTSGGGLGLYTGRAFTGLTNQQEWPAWDGRYLPITDLLYREAGELWAASADGGVGRLTETEWQVFAPDVTLAQGVTTLAATNDRLWLGTAAGWAAVELVGDSCRYAARWRPGHGSVKCYSMDSATSGWRWTGGRHATKRRAGANARVGR